ncbi:MAG: GerMN domain-containing protein [Acidobacteria bacterium]|nr:GerMN domain-containing protein [Acidobacteriota bacterium]
MRRVVLVGLLGAAIAVAIGWLLVAGMPRWFGPRVLDTAAVPIAPGTSAADARRIRANLFFVSEDGMRLVSVEREVAYGENTAEQARAILTALLGPAPEPLAGPLPEGTALRGVYLTDRGEAYVDLSATATTAHRGGSLDELFSVYAVVNTLTTNLPAIGAVQILVDGREVDSLAGHIDLRHPLRKNLEWTEAPE